MTPTTRKCWGRSEGSRSKRRSRLRIFWNELDRGLCRLLYSNGLLVMVRVKTILLSLSIRVGGEGSSFWLLSKKKNVRHLSTNADREKFGLRGWEETQR
jgi:hypothetical protein